jgi:molybdopterin-containing oxidoreductase family iron-sulfur binding subunit
MSTDGETRAPTGDDRADACCSGAGGGHGAECGCDGSSGGPAPARGNGARRPGRLDGRLGPAGGLLEGDDGAGRQDGGPAAPGASPAGPSRRDFLKLLGVTGAGAAAAGCSPPETTDKLIPFLVDPDDTDPGENTAYATLLAEGGPEPLGVHAWVRDGRAIMLEGNDDFPTNRGGISALAQSALQDLYDPDRFRGPRRGDGGGLSEASWEDALSAAGEALSQAENPVLITGATSGTRDRFCAEWAEAVGAERLRWEPLGHEAQRRAHDLAFGRAEIPEYALESADHVVSFGADFQGTWVAPVELSRRFARARDLEDGRHAPLTFVGPRLSLTGTNADDWLPARPGTSGLVALAVARVVAEASSGEEARRARKLLVPYTPERAAEQSDLAADRIRALGEALASAERPVALPPGPAAAGSSDADAHVAVALLNWTMGAVGRTVRFGTGPVRPATATASEMEDLARRIDGGDVDLVLVAGANPAYDVPASTGLPAALEDVTVVSLSPHPDETAVAADWVLPSHHELESWGDAEVRPGQWALGQPVMRPVFDTRQREDALMGVAAAAGVDPADAFGAEAFSDYLREAWREKHGAWGVSEPFGDWWEASLQRGGRWDRAAEPVDVELSGDVADRGFDVPDAPGEGRFDLVVFPTPQLYDGRGANRGWMQEFPDPVTKVVWGSWVELHPETAAPLGLEDGDVVEVRSDAGSVRAPVYLNRGVRPDAAALPLGQGHTAYGRSAEGRGVNPLHLLPSGSGDVRWAPGTVEVVATGETGELVVPQGSDSDLGREIGELMGVEEARRREEEHEIDLGELVEAAWDSDPESPYRWGMTIDLNACNGCGACVTACYAENNLPVVGKERVAQGREMSWLRIERWYEETEGDGPGGDGHGFQTVHQPMLCQHCGDAPCEPVCPVYATYHSPEGLNVQVYNRCVGTRYCSNNCPYKVRRFNWFSYDFPYPLNLQLNPDVTVRDKGVMEKCTFCVQRINRAKVEAKEQGRLVRDGEVETACQSACPTEAIAFGNLKDPNSDVSRIAQGARSYHVLEELNTRPAVTYLEDVTHAEVPETGHGDGHGGDGDGGDHGGGASGHASAGDGGAAAGAGGDAGGTGRGGHVSGRRGDAGGEGA